MTPPPSLQDLIDTVQQDSPSEDLLDLLVTASTTVSHLEDVNDALLGHYVDRCRRAGLSWSQISGALGVSKQAVHKRFAEPIADRIITATPHPTFERFTTRARSVLVAANAAALAQQKDEIGGGHLLVGLFAEPEGLAAKALTAMQVAQSAVEAALALPAAEPDQAAPGEARTEAPAADSTSLPGTAERLRLAADARAALRNALVEALEYGHNYIGTEHILLGLIRDPDAPAARILSQLGAEPTETKVRISELLRGFTTGPAGGS
jgi:ATP-dependent Clp protease ATP-binding subunit ClpA